MAAPTNSLTALLSTLCQSLSSASSSTPEPASITPPSNGIKLLDVKNDLFLAYLQNLVFLIILKIRNHKSGVGSSDNHGDSADNIIDDAVVKKLIEMRIYLEKGVRPLESRLKYQIDKVLLAASAAPAVIPIASHAKVANGEYDSGSDDESSDEEEVDMSTQAEDMQFGPQARSFTTSVAATERDARSDVREEQDGLYRPPRITATAMPTTSGKAEKENKRANVSRTLEEFVNTELSTAPIAQPSIGSNTIPGGRRSKSERELRDEQERREYEERNYVRLPKESKKDRAKKGRPRDAGYGGEEWRLGEVTDRIERLTKRRPGEVKSVLEKSRKRASTEDGPKQDGTGVEIGQGFAKRVKTLSTPRKRGQKKH